MILSPVCRHGSIKMSVAPSGAIPVAQHMIGVMVLMDYQEPVSTRLMSAVTSLMSMLPSPASVLQSAA